MPKVKSSHFDLDRNDLFVARYILTSAYFESDLPSFLKSLSVFAESSLVTNALGALGRDVSCLFQGYTAPQNAHALRCFLSALGISIQETVAVDLLDIPNIYKRLGVEIPELRFIQGDACDLTNWFKKSSFEIVIQDFTLNCIPPIFAPALVKEAHRLLKADGIAMISFTDSSGLQPIGQIHDVLMQHGLTWLPDMRGLNELPIDVHDLMTLAHKIIGATMATIDQEQLIFVTPPDGRFEFFQPVANTLQMIRNSGFDILSLQRSLGSDPCNLQCMRYRCLLRPTTQNL